MGQMALDDEWEGEKKAAFRNALQNAEIVKRGKGATATLRLTLAEADELYEEAKRESETDPEGLGLPADPARIARMSAASRRIEAAIKKAREK